jgi:ABC-type glycerol-3-phosphate transport system substrate-binding protein
LNELITGDSEFKLSDYVEEVLNYGVLEGKRYFIPYDYSFNVFISAKNILEKNNLKLDMTKWSWKYIGDMAKRYRIQNAGEKSYLFDCNLKISAMIRSSGMKFVDYANKKSSFDCPEFLGLLEAYKDIYPSIYPEGYSNLEDLFNNGVCILVTDVCGYPEGLFNKYNLMQNKLKSELEIYPYPTLDGNKHIYPTTNKTIGINSKCNIKSEAFDFVKILISKDLQSHTDSYNNDNLIVGKINKAAYESDKKFYMSDKVKQLIPSGFLPLPVSLADKLDGMIELLKTGEWLDNEVNKMIEEEMPDFLNGKKTAKQTAEAIDEKVNLYLNE